MKENNVKLHKFAMICIFIYLKYSFVKFVKYFENNKLYRNRGEMLHHCRTFGTFDICLKSKSTLYCIVVHSITSLLNINICF